VRARRARAQVQIEYEYISGDPHSQRLSDWYEDGLGFRKTSHWVTDRLIGLVIGHGRGVQFRRCVRVLPALIGEN
jgi:hypothetical protein